MLTTVIAPWAHCGRCCAFLLEVFPDREVPRDLMLPWEKNAAWEKPSMVREMQWISWKGTTWGSGEKSAYDVTNSNPQGTGNYFYRSPPLWITTWKGMPGQPKTS